MTRAWIFAVLLLAVGCKYVGRPSEADYVIQNDCQFEIRVEPWDSTERHYDQARGVTEVGMHPGWSSWKCPDHVTVYIDDSKTPAILWAKEHP